MDKIAPATGNPTHAGGVVFCRRLGTAEYLLVEATNDPSQWVLPKGHVEEGEQHRETAVREVHEETGVWARIGAIPSRPPKRSDEEWERTVAGKRLAADLGTVSYTVDGAMVSIRFYLMEAVGRGLCQERDRKHLWLPLEEAKKRASHNETRELLQLAAKGADMNRTQSIRDALTAFRASLVTAPQELMSRNLSFTKVLSQSLRLVRKPVCSREFF